MDLDDNRHDRIRPIQWRGDHLLLLDQRRLPFETVNLRCDNATDVAKAIRELAVRGAPAIGISAAWGVVLAGQGVQAANGVDAERQIAPQLDALNASRPTAVNLMWAIRRMRESLLAAGEDWLALITAEAGAIAREDLAANRRMGQLGAALIAPGSGVLTHCNTGSLATAGFGTALGVIRAGVAEGRIAKVYAGETRPWGQGARLTAWELQQDGIPPTLIADSAAAHLMKTGAVQWLIVGADRICANGDTANKIGTYAHAIAAKHHGVKVMVVAPSSTVDLATAHGDDIEIELREARELLFAGGQRVVAEGVAAWNPVFDVTPGSLIDVIVTEKGLIEQPDEARMRAVFCRP
ncbi:S-methyl-5-thioribose-1-phosphate isomerase [Silanimonas sp.]|uniref:S-methyl-5-thioribose-1-phosphate isomerase n=1 Tax=Silanimonas sp. TaxID=1929290 RepID=UPI001BC0DE33|nr:S-methyl-5-thioribose-1-phosphate isomerase [Silanimonas sp.]MBS3896094.1 S-methyl-5-thioribose-1-phosphate isomerase [Silanimonas sp.]MBS3923683.1 S-methyl-5-thioribose-1-phosphate isomerase [Xanthomonadaceae bacterium]